MYSLGKSKELLWENFVSNIDVCTTCSLKWGYEMHLHHEIHSQLSIHFTLETTLLNYKEAAEGLSKDTQ